MELSGGANLRHRASNLLEKQYMGELGLCICLPEDIPLVINVIRSSGNLVGQNCQSGAIAAMSHCSALCKVPQPQRSPLWNGFYQLPISLRERISPDLIIT